MKAIKLIVIGIGLIFASTLQAQVSVNINIGSPPLWGPVGYTEVRYYYLPDVEAYYDVQTSMFIYYGGSNWIYRTYLPSRYRNYDLYYGYKVVMHDYHGNTPYTYFKEYKMKYAKGYHGPQQKTIGEKPGRGNGNQNSQGNSNIKANQSNKNHSGNHSNVKKSKGNGGIKRK